MWLVIEQGEYGEIREVTTFRSGRAIAAEHANAVARYYGMSGVGITESGDFIARADGSCRITLWDVGD